MRAQRFACKQLLESGNNITQSPDLLAPKYAALHQTGIRFLRLAHAQRSVAAVEHNGATTDLRAECVRRMQEFGDALRLWVGDCGLQETGRR